MKSTASNARRDGPRLRVLHVLSDDAWGGAEAQVFGLLRELREYPDLDVRVVLFNAGLLKDRLSEVGLEPTVLPESMGSLTLMARLYRLLRSMRPDVVHTHGYKQNVIGGLAARLAGRASLRTQHGAWEIPGGWRTAGPMARRFVDLLVARYVQQRIVAVSEPLAEGLVRHVPPAKVVVVENGLFLGDLPTRARAGDGNGSPVTIGFVGRLVPVKRVDLFLDAAALALRRWHEPLRFRVFGDGPLFATAVERAERLGISSHVEFVGFTPALTRELLGVDLLVMTSDHEGLPMILLEALALQVPIVAPAVGAITSIVRPEYGILVRAQAPAAYCDAIVELLRRRKEFVGTIRSAPQFVAARYSSARQAQEYYALYRSIAG